MVNFCTTYGESIVDEEKSKCTVKIMRQLLMIHDLDRSRRHRELNKAAMKNNPKIFFRRKKVRDQAAIHSHHIKPGLAERSARKLEKSPVVRIWVRINQCATVLALAVALLAFGLAYKRYNEDNMKRDEELVKQAWDVVVRMAGRQSNGGQVSALEQLVSQGVFLGPVDLHKTYLAKAKLKGVDLHHANLDSVDLSEADLRSANFSGANLANAVLIGADLSNANFVGANLAGAQLIGAKVDISIILSASLRLADMTGVQFVYVDENGEALWDWFNDALAEASGAEDRQSLIDSAYADIRHQKLQHKHLPFTPNQKKCHHGVNYYSRILAGLR